MRISQNDVRRGHDTKPSHISPCQAARLYLEAAMVVLLVLLTIGVFLGIDAVKTHFEHHAWVPRGTMYTTSGFEALGCLAQDGGEPVEIDYEI